MNSKERILRTIEHKETDRVPADTFCTSWEDLNRVMKYLNINNYEKLFERLGVDVWYINSMPYIGEKRFYNGSEADFWGITEKAYRDGDSSKECPLVEISSVDDVENYRWPEAKDFDDSNILQEIKEHNNFAIIGGVWAPIFHNITWLCGFENTLANLALKPEISEALIRHVTDFWIGYAKKVLEAGKGKIDIIENCNDFGAQDSMLMNPVTFRKFFKPALKRLYDVTKEYSAKVFQHSCGSILPIIPDLIEIGVDIINPVQVSAAGMEPEKLKEKYGEFVTFDGGIDTQHILPEGSVEEVKTEVRRIIGIMAQGGGYILNSSQGLEKDIPVENIISMYDEGQKIRFIDIQK